MRSRLAPEPGSILLDPNVNNGRIYDVPLPENLFGELNQLSGQLVASSLELEGAPHPVRISRESGMPKGFIPIDLNAAWEKRKEALAALRQGGSHEEVLQRISGDYGEMLREQWEGVNHDSALDKMYEFVDTYHEWIVDRHIIPLREENIPNALAPDSFVGFSEFPAQSRLALLRSKPAAIWRERAVKQLNDINTHRHARWSVLRDEASPTGWSVRFS